MTKKKGLQRRISNNSMMKSNDRKNDLKTKKVYNSSMESIFRKYVLSLETLEMDTAGGSGYEINLRSTYHRILLETICHLIIQE